MNSSHSGSLQNQLNANKTNNQTSFQMRPQIFNHIALRFKKLVDQEDQYNNRMKKKTLDIKYFKSLMSEKQFSQIRKTRKRFQRGKKMDPFPRKQMKILRTLPRESIPLKKGKSPNTSKFDYFSDRKSYYAQKGYLTPHSAYKRSKKFNLKPNTIQRISFKKLPFNFTDPVSFTFKAFAKYQRTPKKQKTLTDIGMAFRKSSVSKTSNTNRKPYMRIRTPSQDELKSNSKQFSNRTILSTRASNVFRVQQNFIVFSKSRESSPSTYLNL